MHIVEKMNKKENVLLEIISTQTMWIKVVINHAQLVTSKTFQKDRRFALFISPENELSRL